MKNLAFFLSFFFFAFAALLDHRYRRPKGQNRHKRPQFFGLVMIFLTLEVKFVAQMMATLPRKLHKHCNKSLVESANAAEEAFKRTFVLLWGTSKEVRFSPYFTSPRWKKCIKTSCCYFCTDITQSPFLLKMAQSWLILIFVTVL